MQNLHFLPFGRLFQKLLRLFVDSKSCQNLFCQTDAPGFIRQKNPDSTLLQETQTDGVECSRLKSGKTAALLSSLPQPVPNFSRCLVRKGHCRNPIRVYLLVIHQIQKSRNQCLGFSGSRSCNDSRPSGRRMCRLLLLLIKSARILSGIFRLPFSCYFYSFFLLFVRLFSLRRHSLRSLHFFLPCFPGFCLLSYLFFHSQHTEKIHLPVCLITLFLIENPDFSVFSVKSRTPCHFPCPEPFDSFCNQSAGHMPDLFHRNIPQNLKLRPEACRQLLVLPLHALACGTVSQSRPDDFRQRDQTFKPLCSRSLILFRPVRHLLNPVGHSDRDLAPAHRADSAILFGLFRAQAKPALAVPVHMIFSFLREEFDSSQKSRSCLHCGFQSLIGKLRIQKIRLPPEFCRRMGIRIGDQLEPVQSRHSPVHRRVRGKPGFHRMHVAGEVSKTFFHGIKP